MNIKPYAFLAIGVLLLVVGINMKYAEKKWDEVVVRTEEISTKGKNAAIGAAGGAAVGGGVAALVGGVGVVIAGTGIGLPAGAAMIAVAAAIGGVTGGVVGAATGETQTNSFKEIVHHVEPTYETWQWVSVIIMAAIFFVLAIINFRKKLMAEKAKPM
ncbi:MAG: hypothetical protein HOO97_09885 [Sideroxydans sp.]|nr:hypothetical protein [Sideroxydans sp.]